MTQTILITGAGGQVGHELATVDRESNARRIALSRHQLDITDREQIAASFATHSPAIVINAAAYTQVDRAEEEQALAYAINRDGVANLADSCNSEGVPLLHISTDYVFHGSKQGAYTEDDPVAPIGVYGASKAAGEAVLQARLKQHIILRTSWVFSATGNNFVKTMLRLGREREELGIVNDQHGCPTSARSIAEALLLIADRYLRGDEIEWGIYHYCNAPETTWFGFAQTIFKQVGGFDNLKLNAINTSDYPTSALRPINSTLNCSKLKSNFEIEQQEWAQELKLVLHQLSD